MTFFFFHHLTDKYTQLFHLTCFVRPPGTASCRTCPDDLSSVILSKYSIHFRLWPSTLFPIDGACRSSVTTSVHPVFIFFGASAPPLANPTSLLKSLRSHKNRHSHTAGRTPLNEWPARRTDLYLHIIHTTHTTDECPCPPRFEPAIAAIERPQTYALERTATRTCTLRSTSAQRACIKCAISCVLPQFMLQPIILHPTHRLVHKIASLSSVFTHNPSSIAIDYAFTISLRTAAANCH